MPPLSGVAVIGKDELDPFDEAPQNSTWESAFDTDRVSIVRIRPSGGAPSGWHTHGNRDAYGVAIDGRARFEYGAGDQDAIDVRAGDFSTFRRGWRIEASLRATMRVFSSSLWSGPGSWWCPPRVPRYDPPERLPRTAGEDQLVPTGMLENLTRLTPFPDAAVQQVRGHAAGRIESSWHHHGDKNVFGYVLNGEGYVEWGLGDGVRTLARAGEFFHVPPGFVHRDVNPSDDEQDYLLWLTGSDPRIVHVDGPDVGGE